MDRDKNSELGNQYKLIWTDGMVEMIIRKYRTSSMFP